MTQNTYTTLSIAALGALGVLALSPTVPTLILRVVPSGKKLRIPVPALTVLALLQTLAVVFLFAWLGARFGSSSGLRSIMFDVTQREGIRGLAAALAAGAATGGIAGASAYSLSAPLVAYLRGVPLVARLLYGGLTEEVVMRWGLLATVIAVLRYVISDRAAAILVGVMVTNVLFAAAHLPMLRAGKVAKPTNAALVIFILSLPWGFLAVKLGIEAAMVAHATFHLAVELRARFEGRS